MRIIMTGGGTAGHITPNIALFPGLKKKGFEIHYIGTQNGMERSLIENESIPYHIIKAGKLRRYLDFKNITDIAKIGAGFLQAIAIIRKIKPDIIFSKGGFVSCPVVWAAWVNRVPAVIHESDMTPGLANKLSMPFADKICYTFPETGQYLKSGKGILTGMPVREELFSGNRQTGLKICGFTGSKPVIMIIGGSQGSGVLNSIVRDSLEELLKTYNICHICGKGSVKKDLRLAGYKQFEYVSDELPHLFALAEVVAARAGATSLFELLSLKKPSLLIPLSKNASRGDQILNARSFEKQGFSVVLPEERLNKETFIDNLNDVFKNRSKFIKNMSGHDTGNGADNVLKVIMSII